MSESPSNSKGNTSNNNGVTNRTKFPFILMPVSNIGDRRTTEDCDLVLPSLHLEPSLQSQHEAVTKAARRNAIIQKELRSRFPAESEIRRCARTPYPTSNPISQMNLAEDDYIPSANPGATLLFNGISMPREQFQEMILPRLSTRNRSSKFRTPRILVEDHDAIPARASASTSTPQLVIGRPAAGEGIEAEAPLKQQSLEMKNQLSRLDLKLQDRDNEVMVLKKELTSLKETMDKSVYEAQTSKAHQATLRHEFVRLEQQLESLEERLESHDDLAHLKEFLVSQATLSSQSIAPKPQRSKSPDFDRLINMIRELNSIAGNYQSVELCYTNCGATFKPPDAIVLTLYRNGITLDDSDVFRPFDALPTLQFIQDIYDGYFPTELQSKYPEGITLVVKDRRQTLHPGESTFQGKGRKLSERVEVLPKFVPTKKRTSSKKPPEESPPVESAPVELKRLSSSPSCVNLPDLTPSTKPLTQTQRALYKSVPQFITLKLRNLKTEATYNLKTTSSVTPDDILLHLETHMDPRSPVDDTTGIRKYELVNSFPFGVFTVPGTTFRDYGIISNAFIYFRPI